MAPSGNDSFVLVVAIIGAVVGIGQLVAMCGAMVMFFKSRGAYEQTLSSRVEILEKEQTRQSGEDDRLRDRLKEMSDLSQTLLISQTKSEGRTEGHEGRIRDLELLVRRIERLPHIQDAFRSIHETPRPQG